MIRPGKKKLTKEDVLNILKEEQSFLKRRYDVKKIAIFGSFAKGRPKAKSDVDIFVEFGTPKARNFFGLIDYLEKRFGREVDILTPGAMQTMRVGRIAEDIKRTMVDV